MINLKGAKINQVAAIHLFSFYCPKYDKMIQLDPLFSGRYPQSPPTAVFITLSLLHGKLPSSLEESQYIFVKLNRYLTEFSEFCISPCSFLYLSIINIGINKCLPLPFNTFYYLVLSCVSVVSNSLHKVSGIWQKQVTTDPDLLLSCLTYWFDLLGH